MTTMTPMRRRTFQRLRDIVYASSGISLGPRKEALVSARVGKRIRALGMAGYEEYLRYLEEQPGEVVGLLDAVSTNVTSFYREPHHFGFIAEQARDWYAKGQRRFRFWSAACSTGEEPFSLAMALRDALPEPDVDLRILATDICTEALDRCRDARYDEERVRPVPPDVRERWMRRVPCETLWTPRPEIKRLVVFHRLNLSQVPFAMRGPLDAVFCRNVMIYFDDTVRARLLAEVHRLLKPGGLLVVGHAESLAGLIGDFRYVRPSVYRRG